MDKPSIRESVKPFSLLLVVVLATAYFGPIPVRAQLGGPVILMGIDAEDGGVGGHGPLSSYTPVVNAILAAVANGGTNILVIGCGKSPGDHVTTWWSAIDAAISGHTKTCVNGAAISTVSFAGYAMIAVASNFPETGSGGLTQAENNNLATRQADIANFVNTGGGLLGFTQNNMSNKYAYIAGLGAFTFGGVFESNITPTTDGIAIMPATQWNALDVCCWHDEYLTFPTFLDVLATYPGHHIHPAAIGGLQVVIPGLTLSPGTDTNFVGTSHTVTALAEQTVGTAPPTPVSGVLVSFTVSGANTASGTCVTGSTGQCTFTYTGTVIGTDTITATATVAGQPLMATASKVWIAPPLEIDVTKFFTDSDLNPLPLDANGIPKVDVVLANGVVRSTNPGQVIVWVRVKNIGTLSVLSLTINEVLPMDWTVHPPWDPAKGAIRVYFEFTDGSRVQITQPSTITATTGPPETVSVAIPDISATAAGKALDTGESILLAVKIDYALEHTVQPASNYPINYADTATATGYELASFTGTSSMDSFTGFFIAYAKVVGNVDGSPSVSLTDGMLLIKAYGTRRGDSGWNAAADFNFDGVVDSRDAADLALYYGSSS